MVARGETSEDGWIEWTSGEITGRVLFVVGAQFPERVGEDALDRSRRALPIYFAMSSSKSSFRQKVTLLV